MTATDFTPVASLLGGALIGASAVMLMAAKGRIAGVSGIAVRLLPPYADNEFAGRLAFILGIVVAPLAVLLATGTAPLPSIEAGPGLLAFAGLLVGFGSVWGNGCTSGHGICGLARLSVRSMVSTAVFMFLAVATVYLLRHVIGA